MEEFVLIMRHENGKEIASPEQMQNWMQQTMEQQAEKLNLIDNHFYFTLLGELYKSINALKAKEHFQKAILLAKTQPDKLTIQKNIDLL